MSFWDRVSGVVCHYGCVKRQVLKVADIAIIQGPECWSNYELYDDRGIVMHNNAHTRISAQDKDAFLLAQSRGELVNTPYPMWTSIFPVVNQEAGLVPLQAVLEMWIQLLFSNLLPTELWQIVYTYGLTDWYRCLQCQLFTVTITADFLTSTLTSLTRVCVADSPLEVPRRCKSSTCTNKCALVPKPSLRGYQTILSRRIRCTCGQPLYQFACSYNQ